MVSVYRAVQGDKQKVWPRSVALRSQHTRPGSPFSHPQEGPAGAAESSAPEAGGPCGWVAEFLRFVCCLLSIFSVSLVGNAAPNQSARH